MREPNRPSITQKVWSHAVLPGVLVLAASFVGVPAVGGGRRAAVPTETIAVSHLRKPVEILVDHWGVPHIYAKNESDLFFAQGFNAARARLFQIDLWRRRGLGQLSEVFGPAFVQQDAATRLFLYRRDMKKEWAVYGRDTQQITRDFVAGINAYIDWLDQHPDQMPQEFRRLRYTPARWAPADVFRIRTNSLIGNLESEVELAKETCATNLQTAEGYQDFEPPWQTRIPQGLDPCLPKDVLKAFNLAMEQVRFTPETGKIAVYPPRVTPAADSTSQALAESNNWVVAPSKSATGRAIMANDPHRIYTEPSLRYIVDMDSPTLHIAGFGEPAVPGVSNGHNN